LDTSAIAGASMSIHTAQLQQAVSTSVLKMTMTNARDSNQALLEMMKISSQILEQSVHPYLGKAIDILG
jgi:hypothetical protein